MCTFVEKTNQSSEQPRDTLIVFFDNNLVLHPVEAHSFLMSLASRVAIRGASITSSDPWPTLGSEVLVKVLSAATGWSLTFNAKVRDFGEVLRTGDNPLGINRSVTFDTIHDVIDAGLIAHLLNEASARTVASDAAWRNQNNKTAGNQA